MFSIIDSWTDFCFLVIFLFLELRLIIKYILVIIFNLEKSSSSRRNDEPPPVSSSNGGGGSEELSIEETK